MRVILLIPCMLWLSGSPLPAADEAAGWPYVQPFNLLRSIGNFQGGPELEIVLVNDSDLVMLSHLGDVLDELSLASITGIGGVKQLLAGDIDPTNPGVELVLVYSSGWAIIDPAPLSITATESQVGMAIQAATARLADLDGDGDQELLASQNIPNPLGVYFSFDYTPSGMVSDSFSFPPRGSPWDFLFVVAADVDFDGVAEIAPVGSSWPFYLLGATGSPYPGFPIAPWQGTSLGMLAFADLDGVGGAEIIGNDVQVLHGHSNTGTIHFASELVPGSFFVPPAIGNFDSDSHLEIALNGPGIVVFDPDVGEVAWEYTGAHSDFGPLAAGDLNGDGVDEIVGLSSRLNGSTAYYLHALDGLTRQELPGFPHAFALSPSGLFVYVDIYDVDGAGDLEVICSVDGALHVFDVQNTGTPVFSASWPTLHGNGGRNGDYHWGRAPFSHFTRGDANHDGVVNLADAIAALVALFSLEPPACTLALDSNADGVQDLADPIFLLDYLFLAGATPATPFPECQQVARTPLCVQPQCP